MTDQTIPADKVRDIIARYRDGASHRGGMILDDLKALLPPPTNCGTSTRRPTSERREADHRHRTGGSMKPRIIRTREELAALDPDTLIFDTVTDTAMFPMELDAYEDALPSVVIATGEQVRAARQAMEEA